MYDFDKVIDRRGTEATKWDRLRTQYQDETLLPMWLADMDFPVSSAVSQALIKRAQHPIYGYTDRSSLYCQLFANRFHERFQYDVQAHQVVLSTGVMYSISASIRLFTEENDKILIMRPYYHPFVDITKRNKREPLFVDLIDASDQWQIPYQAMEAAAKQCSALLLCNPHNPTGKVFTKAEIAWLADLCERHHLLIISDEIHSDFLYGDVTFTPIMNSSAYTLSHTVSCVAPTKAFNLAGLKISAVLIKNPRMLEQFRTYAETTGINSINLFAMEAVKAAYSDSSLWQRELLAYLSKNRRLCDAVLKQYADRIQYHLPEGTYFLWIDFHDENIHERLIKRHLALSAGMEFGDIYCGYERLNFACPRPLLKKGLAQVEAILTERRKV